MRVFLVVLLLFPVVIAQAWGGRGHRSVVRMTIGSLAGDAALLLTPLRERIEHAAMDPDDRADDDRVERVRHFYDLEALGWPRPDPMGKPASVDISIKRRRALLKKMHSVHELNGRSPGTLPVAIEETYAALVDAIRKRDEVAIVRYAADLLHYVADAHQPLHATDAYNGLTREHKGIHAAFETNLLDRCPAALPSSIAALPPLDERPAEVVMTALIESHALARDVLAADLGCPRGVDRHFTCPCIRTKQGAACQLPPKRAFTELPCDLISDVARTRLELAAARSKYLLERATADARR